MKIKAGYFIYFAVMIFMIVSTSQAGPPGPDNTFYGDQAGVNITAGLYNAFYGANAGFSTTTGFSNIFIGDSAGFSNLNGNYNTFIGSEAGYENTTSNNTFIGYGSGYDNTTGTLNTFLGSYSGGNNIDASENTFLGSEAGFSNSKGWYNTFVGVKAGRTNTDAEENTFVGSYAGFSNSGFYNTFVGSEAGRSNTTADENTFLGDYSGYTNRTGANNTFVGNEAGYTNDTGNQNVFIGNEAGHENSNGSLNVFIGNQAGFNENGSNRLYIDNSNTASPLIYGEFDSNVLRINGSLGVGTAGSPSTALEVNGTVTASAFAGDGSSLINVPTSAHIHSGTDIVSATVAETFIDSAIARDTEVTAAVDAHAARTDNPHSVTAAQIGASLLSHNHDASYVKASGDTITGDLIVDGIVDIYNDLYVVGNLYLESDAHAKTNIMPIKSSLDKVNSIRGVSFNWNDDKDSEGRKQKGSHFGVIAQEIEEVLPELVRTGKNGTRKVAYMELIPVLIEAIKEQQKNISVLTDRVNDLERELKTERNLAKAYIQ